MSKSETIAKLESLLARVRTRAAQPRKVVVAPAPPPAAAPLPAPAPAHMVAPAPPPAPAHVPSPAPAHSVDDEVTLAQPTRPPPADTEVFVEVEVQESIGDTVIGVPAEEVVVAEAFESRERLVAAEPVTEIAGPSSPAPTEELSPEAVVAEDDVEEAPLSSRRPVAPQPEERLAEMAFGAEEPRPPRHTPPPESGRLPAAPVVEFDGDVTGVREAPMPPHRVEVAEHSEPRVSQEPEPRRTRELVPEATRAALVPSDAVADVVGQAQRFAPSSFVALLDASLAL